jgi:phosphatidate cytidylyltransferase
MRQRILTALVLSTLLVGSLMLSSPWYFGIVLICMLAVGAWEWSGFLQTSHTSLRVGYVLTVLALTAGIRWFWFGPAQFLVLVQWAVVWWLLAFVWLLRKSIRVAPWLAAVAGVFALTPTTLVLHRVAATWPHGTAVTIWIIALAAAMDTGGLIVGKNFGRLKLAPVISPGKTWEGVLGGLFLVLILALAVSRWLPVHTLPFVALCLAAGCLSVVGDLTESLLKRAAGVKDSGRIFPGHGGILDRIDSVTAASPVMALGLIWLGYGT